MDQAQGRGSGRGQALAPERTQRGTHDGGRPIQGTRGQQQAVRPDDKVRENLRSIGTETGWRDRPLDVPQDYQVSEFERDVVHKALWEIRNNPQVRREKMQTANRAIVRLVFPLLATIAVDHFYPAQSIGWIKNVFGLLLIVCMGCRAWLQVLDQNNNH